MKQSMRIFILMAVVLVIAPLAFSQTPTRRITPTLTSAMQANEALLTTVEGRIGRVETARRIAPTDNSDIDKTLFAYAEAMKRTFDGAIQQAQTAATSNGRSGTVGDLARFETLASQHVTRIEIIRDRLFAIDQAVANNAIRDDSRIDPMHEMVEATAWIRGPWKLDLVPEADASVAVVCVAVCQTTVGAGCATCVAAAGVFAVKAWTTFQTCWNNAKQPGRGWKRAACLSLFISKLA